MSTIKVTNIQNPSSGTDDIQIGANGSVNIDNGTLYVDAANNRVGIGTTSPGNYQSGKNNLVIANTGGSAGLTVASTSTGYGEIAFADGTTGDEKYRGQISYDHTNDALSFFTTANERFRCDSSGRLLVNTSTVLINESQISATGSGNTACLKSTVAGNQPLLLWNSDTAGINNFVTFFTETSYTGRGGIDYNRPAGLVRYNTTSDARLKSNIKPSESALNSLNAINVREYTWKETGYKIKYGFVAQELNDVFPDAVKAGDDGEEIADIWAVDNSKLVPLLAKALQEALAKIETLEAQNATQSAAIAALETRLTALEGGQAQ
jgi:hypothetical protein